MSAVLAGESPNAVLIARAFGAPHELWRRALAIEACAVQFDRALRRSAISGSVPSPLREWLSEATTRAVRDALAVPGQVAELAEVARECGTRVLLLKGAARLLSDDVPGGRSLSDVDVLAAPDDARRLHALLQDRLGYQSMSAAPEHHLPVLSRPGALPIEVHVQLGPRPTSLDERIWRDARELPEGIAVPSPTGALLHALEHGALVHWAVRYRLRDLLDVAEGWSADVDGTEVVRYVRSHTQRRALETTLGAARRFACAIPVIRPSAWRTVRRVARARHVVAAYVRRPELAKSLCIAAGILAEASPKAMLRPLELALFGVRQARADLPSRT
jgi:Uncharacterised nucleotidyltransferase